MTYIKTEKRTITPVCQMCGYNKNIMSYQNDDVIMHLCPACATMIFDGMLEKLPGNDFSNSPVLRRRLHLISEKIDLFLRNTKKTSRAESPQEITQTLDEYVIGQSEAKKALAIALYNHMKRTARPELKIRKSNILLSGPTGSGKTLLAKTLARIAKVPFVSVDATSLTPNGYVGKDVEDMLLSLLRNANGNVDEAERGIVFIDEIDKIRKNNTGIREGLNGEEIQQSLLKLLEEQIVDVPYGDRKQKRFVQMNTKDILFICGGAFVDLEKPSSVTKVTGFSAVPDVQQREPGSEKDAVQLFIDYGFIPELMGRLPILIPLEELKEEDLIHILKDTKESLVQEYQNLFLADDVHLIIPDSVLRKIAECAIEKKTGARGLRAIMEKMLSEAMYALPYEENVNVCEVTEETILTGKTKVYWSKEYADTWEEAEIQLI